MIDDVSLSWDKGRQLNCTKFTKGVLSDSYKTSKLCFYLEIGNNTRKG